MDKNTQQPVVWMLVDENDDLEFNSADKFSCGRSGGKPLYELPPVPRDVLMAALGDLRSQCAHALDGYYIPSDASNVRHDIAVIDLAAIADRYASKVQPEPVCQTCGGAGVIGDYLTLVHDCPDCARCDSDPELVSYSPDMATCTLRIGDEQYLFDRHVDEPEPVNQQLLAALKELVIDMKISQGNMRIAAIRDPKWEGCAETIQPRVDAAETAIAAAQQLASAQPVAVPDNLLTRLEHHMRDKENTAFARSTMRELHAMLSAAQKPEGNA